MKKIILVRYGEIILKGLNRPIFEDKLINNIKRGISSFGKVAVTKSQARIFVEPESDEYDFLGAMDKLTKIFGIVSVSEVWKIDSDFEEIKNYSLVLARELVEAKGFSTFKVDTQRGNKRFSMNSMEISAEVGAHILTNIPSLKVDVNKPEFIIYIEVRELSYIYSQKVPAQGGMPTGTNGKAMLLISGGIDSPVAGYMIAKRGVEIDAVHFYSYPYTSERAKQKVIDLIKIVSTYCHKIRLHVVPFTEIQLEINEKCPSEQSTIIMRRVMMDISERIAKKEGSLALITGESIGQVASQTIQSLAVTNIVVDMPVFRPLIGMDKDEVVQIARKIGTFETSILPYEDCCTVFVAKHPNTKPKLDKILLSEENLEIAELIEQSIENTEVIVVSDGKVVG